MSEPTYSNYLFDFEIVDPLLLAEGFVVSYEPGPVRVEDLISGLDERDMEYDGVFARRWLSGLYVPGPGVIVLGGSYRLPKV